MNETETKYIKMNTEVVLSPSKELSITLNTFISEDVKSPLESNLNAIKYFQCLWCDKILDSEDLKYKFHDKYHCSLKCFQQSRELLSDIYNSEGVY